MAKVSQENTGGTKNLDHGHLKTPSFPIIHDLMAQRSPGTLAGYPAPSRGKLASNGGDELGQQGGAWVKTSTQGRLA